MVLKMAYEVALLARAIVAWISSSAPCDMDESEKVRSIFSYCMPFPQLLEPSFI